MNIPDDVIVRAWAAFHATLQLTDFDYTVADATFYAVMTEAGVSQEDAAEQWLQYELRFDPTIWRLP